MVVDIPEVMSYANFGEDRLQGLGVAGGQSYIYRNIACPRAQYPPSQMRVWKPEMNMDSLQSYTHLMSLHLWKRRTLLRTFQLSPLNKAKLFLSQHPHFSFHPNHAPQQQRTHKARTFHQFKFKFKTSYQRLILTYLLSCNVLHRVMCVIMCILSSYIRPHRSTTKGTNLFLSVTSSKINGF